MIEGHGDDIYSWNGRIVSNFSSNIHSRRNIGLERALLDSITSIYNYPPPEASAVRHLISEMEKVNYENITVTSGAVEAIYIIASAFKGHSAVFFPTFREYEDACLMEGHRISHISSFDDIPADSETIWICNPNNPDGRIFPAEEIRRQIRHFPDKLFIIDQAYEDYTMERMLDAKTVETFNNVIIIKSLTKKFSIPGLRIGYMLSSCKMADIIRGRLRPWSVNSLAIEAAMYCLTHKEEFEKNLPTLFAEMKRICTALERLGIKSENSKTNFALCRLPYGEAPDLKEYLIKNHGILIRDASNFYGLDKRYFRFAAQSKKENDNLIKGIESWFSQL